MPRGGDMHRFNVHAVTPAVRGRQDLTNYAKWDVETPDTRIYLLISFDRRASSVYSQSLAAIASTEVTWATVRAEGVK